MRHRLEYLIVRALIAVVRVTPAVVVRGGRHAARSGVLHDRWRAPAHRASAIWRRRFHRGPRPSGARSRARPLPISGGCCSSCCSSRRCRANRCWRASSSTARSDRGSPTRRARACCSSPGISVSGSCRRWCTRCGPSRSASWRARSTIRMLNRLLEDIRQGTGNTVVYRRGTIRRVMRTLQAGHGVAVLIDQHIMSRDAIYVDFFERPAATTSAVAALALAHRRAGRAGVRAAARPRALPSDLRAPGRAAARRLARRGPRVHAALHRRARDVRAPPSRAVAVDAPPLARRRSGRGRRARGCSHRQSATSTASRSDPTET